MRYKDAAATAMEEDGDIEVSADLLESLEISLEALGKSLLRDVGEVLNIQAKDLIKKVYGAGQQQKIRLVLKGASQQQAQHKTFCKVLVQHYSSAFYCGKLSVHDSCFCQTHYSKPFALKLERSLPLRSYMNNFVTPEGVIINRDGNAVGVLKDGIFYKF